MMKEGPAGKRAVLKVVPHRTPHPGPTIMKVNQHLAKRESGVWTPIFWESLKIFHFAKSKEFKTRRKKFQRVRGSDHSLAG